MSIKFAFVVAISAGLITLTGCEQQGEDSLESQLFKLAHMNGCIECHTVSATSVGPSWMAIKDRYKDAPPDEVRALLIESVKKGSKGKYFTWKGGDGMPPLERRVSEEHITRLVDYIVSLPPSR